MTTIPEQIGPYSVEAELGHGGMGVVFRGRDPKLGRLVAIKVLPDDVAKDPALGGYNGNLGLTPVRALGMIARFLRESYLVSGLASAGVVRPVVF